MLSDANVSHTFVCDDLRTVLEFFGVRLDVRRLYGCLFEVTVQLSCGTVHSLVLDLASLAVRRTMLNVLASILTPAFYRAFSSRLNHRSIANHRIDFETPRIVAMSDTSSDVDPEDDDDIIVEEVRRKRVIPLPYIEQADNAPTAHKRRRRTVAALLGDTEYFACKHCFKSFNRRSNMMRHIDRTHCERVVFTCPQCPAVYKHAFHFADHLRGHEDDPQFACDSCEKRFRSRNELRAHVRRNCKEPAPKKSASTSSRRSAQYDPQPGSSRAEAANCTGRFHIPYDFPVTL